MTSIAGLDAFAKSRPKKTRYQGSSKTREHSTHDELQSALVQHLEQAGRRVDFEVPCGRRWADVVIWLEQAIVIVEIKTHAEHWGAGDVVRQLKSYARLLPNRAQLPVRLVLMHEGPLSAAEAFLLTAKQIECVQVEP
jgi:hypothetical protein